MLNVNCQTCLTRFEFQEQEYIAEQKRNININKCAIGIAVESSGHRQLREERAGHGSRRGGEKEGERGERAFEEWRTMSGRPASRKSETKNESQTKSHHGAEERNHGFLLLGPKLSYGAAFHSFWTFHFEAQYAGILTSISKVEKLCQP